MRARLQKIISEYGVCSRRKAEELISAGRVTVNGTAAQPGQTADPETDSICIDGRPLERRPETRSVTVLRPSSSDDVARYPLGLFRTINTFSGRRSRGLPSRKGIYRSE